MQGEAERALRFRRFTSHHPHFEADSVNSAIPRPLVAPLQGEPTNRSDRHFRENSPDIFTVSKVTSKTLVAAVIC
jgi:hypothetical protein